MKALSKDGAFLLEIAKKMNLCVKVSKKCHKNAQKALKLTTLRRPKGFRLR
jgi:hypothetical protein